MGASGWRYFTPYREDINHALQELRQRVFDRGEYEADAEPELAPDVLYKFPTPGTANQKIQKEMATASMLLRAVKVMQRLKPSDLSKPQVKALMYAMRVGADGMPDTAKVEAALTEFLAHGPKPKKPKSIDALLEQCAENGTHTILDIFRGISDKPDFGCASKMPAGMQKKMYGTLKPTRADIEKSAYQACEGLDRWHAFYVVVYKDGVPSEIYFEGVSGD